MSAIHTIDLHYRGRPGSIASYVIDAPGGPVMIECGPGSTVEALERGLAEHGFAPGDVRHLLVTHIHFDHGGAAGWMARHGARVYVHEFGARHLIDPSKLNASARRIYGDQMEALWGELIPIPEEQVTAVHDEDVLDVNGLAIRAIETPGHARHHHAFALENDGERLCFTGDVAACHVSGCPGYVSVPMPPPELDLEAWHASVDRLRRERFDAIYPTHFGRVDDADAHLARVNPTLTAHAECVRGLMDEGLDPAEIEERYTRWFAADAEAAGLPEAHMGFYVLDTLAGMNVSGIVRYWTKRAEAAARA
jgi:glyoxylase-like metal-dependent hydrolase (beta-lactamase superfamily II)